MREVDSSVGVRCPAWLIPARAPRHGDDHDGGSCGSLRVLFHRGFPLLQKLQPGRRAELDHTLQLPGDVTHCGVCFSVDVHRACGILPQHGGLCDTPVSPRVSP
jgi:hypothetical protein